MLYVTGKENLKLCGSSGVVLSRFFCLSLVGKALKDQVRLKDLEDFVLETASEMKSK